MFSEKVIPWAFASLSYNEQQFSDYVQWVIPGSKFVIETFDRGAISFSLVMDKKNGRAWIVNRGTDGFDALGNIRSWLIDASIATSGDGVHNGFQMVGDKAFDFFKNDLENFDHIILCGHSQGAGVAPYEAVLCVENLTLKSVIFFVYAAPPTGNQLFADRVNRCIDSGKLTGYRYVNPHDPIASEKLRNQNSSILNGVDVGRKYYCHVR
jgi:hypothetical protein